MFEPMTSESPFTKIRLSYCVTDAIGGLMDQGAHARTTCALLSIVSLLLLRDVVGCLIPVSLPPLHPVSIS